MEIEVEKSEIEVPPVVASPNRSAPILAREAFRSSRTPSVVANRGYEIVVCNQAFQDLFEAHEDAFRAYFGDEADPTEACGQSLDTYLEGTGYRRSLRKGSVYEGELDIEGVVLGVSVTKLPDSEDSTGGFLLEWFEPEVKGSPELEADVAAMSRVIDGLSRATTVDEAARAALSAVKEAFGWAYASFWQLDREEQALRFSCDVGRVTEEFHAVTASARFREGVGLSGRTWKARDLLFVADLGEMTDCCRRESAQRAGVKSGICFPILAGSEVVGTMDFFSLDVLSPSASRLETLRAVGRLVSSTLAQIRQAEEQTRVANEASAFRSAVDCSTNPLMLTNKDLVITYLNPASYKMLKAQEAALQASVPGFNVETLVGTSIDDFHKNPAHQRRILSDPRNFPFETRVRIAGLTFELVVSALTHEGEVVGMVAEWADVSAEVKAQGHIEELLNAATQGNISERLDCESWEGFTQVVGQGMNDLLGAVQTPLAETKRVVQALSEGDLTQGASEALRGEFAEVADSLNESITNLREVIARIVVSGDHIGRAASELADGNAHLNGRTQQQAAALEETAATIEQLTSTVKQNADNAQSANTLASETRGLAERGGEVVGRAVSAMAEINRSSKKISDIISVIDEIAFQTNLLALNAAVEAARAGEQGRGFAVVATEVRNLAQRSAGAAKEIKALIKDSVEKVEDGSSLVDSSGNTLREIVDSVKRVSELIAEIAAASEEQATGIDQVNMAVAQMDEMTQQNAAMVEEAAAASTSMHEQALALGELVGRFELGADAPVLSAPPPAAVSTRSAPAPAVKPAGLKSAAPKRAPVDPSTPVAEASDDWDEF